MARFSPTTYLIPALIATASHAGEITVESRPFLVAKSFSATVLPTEECALLRLKPKVWTEFKIAEIAAHGSKVKKGDVLVRFLTEELDKKLEDSRQEIKAAELTLAAAELELGNLLETAPHKLAAARRAAEIAKEEHQYFTQVRRKASEDSSAQSLKRYEQILSNQREELNQLAKMYEADDITENTEEIILVRQQDAVAAAEFALRMEALDHRRNLEVTLPRQAQTLAESERDTAISLKKSEAEIPHAIELARLAVESLRTENARAKQKLAQLEADRSQCEFKAAADGVFYHGAIEKGRWTTEELLKKLVIHGEPPSHTAFASLVPTSIKFGLISFLKEEAARAISPEIIGTATLTGREESELKVTLSKLASIPEADGTYRADFSLAWPAGVTPVAGATADIRVISYQQPAAIAVPNAALTHGSSGWTVEVKLADGETEQRAVKRGHVSDEETEILTGLEVGQVVLVP